MGRGAHNLHIDSMNGSALEASSRKASETQPATSFNDIIIICIGVVAGLVLCIVCSIAYLKCRLYTNSEANAQKIAARRTEASIQSVEAKANNATDSKSARDVEDLECSVGSTKGSSDFADDAIR